MRQGEAPDLRALKLIKACELARGSLAAFVRLAWPTLNPRTELKWNWHLDALCLHLEAVTRCYINRLLIEMPPGYSKSTLVSHCWPVWEWLQFPEYRWGFAAYGAKLAIRDSTKRRLILESAWFQAGFRPPWQIAEDQRAKAEFKNTFEGEMVASSVGGPATGFHYDRQVLDDALKPRDVHTVRLQATNEWYEDTWESRKRDDAAEVVVAQRLAERDLLGMLRARGGWEELVLAEKFEPKRRAATKIWTDPRTEPGELLDPVRFPQERVDSIWHNLGPARAAAQRQQNPIAGEGNIFPRDRWRFWAFDSVTPGAEKLPAEFDAIVGSWDGAVDGGKKSDFYSGGVLARKGPRYYLLDEAHFRAFFSEAEKAVKRFAAKWPEVTRWLFEKAALGAAVVDKLKSDTGSGDETFAGVHGMKLVKATEPKIQRAEAISGLVDAGDVYLPHVSIAPWVLDFIEELVAFPFGDNDDRVDMLSQGLRFLSSRKIRDLPTPMPRRPTPAPLQPGVAPPDARREQDLRQAEREARRVARQAERESRRTGDRRGFNSSGA